MFETEDYVYITFTEPALETFNAIGVTPTSYSRVGRVCKNDKGRGTKIEAPHLDDSQYQFSTLFKARMLCGSTTLDTMSTSDNDKYLREEYDGYYATYINEIGESWPCTSFSVQVMVSITSSLY